jgi:hypothetical protein
MTHTPAGPCFKQSTQRNSVTAAAVQDRRDEARRAYPVSQAVAFHHEGELPAADEFRMVMCKDISTSGISFYYPAAPMADHCTLALGREPNVLAVTAKVVHYGPFLGPDGEWLIGCRFVKKVAGQALSE